MSDLGSESDSTLEEMKPHFYADANRFVQDARSAYADLRKSNPPYGLVEPNKDRASFIGAGIKSKQKWPDLELALFKTSEKAFNDATPSISACPYHKPMRALGYMSLDPAERQAPDVEALRESVFPGAAFAPATIVNTLKAFPAIAEIHSTTSDLETLARNSVHTLLREPLRHPQQWAKAFTFTLAEGIEGTDAAIDRDAFLSEEIIRKYTTIGTNRLGQEAIVWSMPTEDFTLQVPVHVQSRTDGSISLYPAGTRLGDIATDEPTIGCPGKGLAYDMWSRTVDVIVGEGMWE